VFTYRGRKKEKDFVQRLIETSKDSEMSENEDEQEGTAGAA